MYKVNDPLLFCVQNKPLLFASNYDYTLNKKKAKAQFEIIKNLKNFCFFVKTCIV